MTSKEYNQIVENHSDGLYRFMLKGTGKQSVAEDLVQLSFERLWKNKKKVLFKKAKAYLFTIAHNAMIDFFRKSKREYTTDELPDRSIEPKTGQFELKEWIDRGLGELTETQRSVIMLRDYEGYSYKEIEEITGLSTSQVKVYIFRARKHLKAFFIKYYKQEMKSYGYSSN